MGAILSAIFNFLLTFNFVVWAILLLIFFGWNFITGFIFVLAILSIFWG